MSVNEGSLTLFNDREKNRLVRLFIFAHNEGKNYLDIIIFSINHAYLSDNLAIFLD
jgi:hypothetical protein